MEQFEQLMRASEQVGTAARPLPLFYALSQGGRAIAAAHADEPWQLRGHGLQLKDDGLPLLDRRVSPEGRADSSFRRVTEATVAPILQEPVTIGALCASLPDFATVGELCGANPRALAMQAIPKSGGAVITMSRDVDAYVVNLPPELASAQDATKAVEEHLKHYPTAAGWTAPNGVRIIPPQDGWGAGTVLHWQVAESVPHPNEPERQARIRDVAPPYLRADSQWCRPAVAPGIVLSPLMTWWALLYGLSMVARYEPAAWVDLLDVNKNYLAVPLEELLKDALEVVPHLVLDALTTVPLLLPPRPH